MQSYNKSVLMKWLNNIEKDVDIDETGDFYDDYYLDKSIDTSTKHSNKPIEESWIDLNKEKQSHLNIINGDAVVDNDDDELSEDEDEDTHLNTSLTTILSRQPNSIDLNQTIQFKDVTTTNTSITSTPNNSMTINKSKKRASNSYNDGSMNKVFIMGIIASLSFSCGYALGQSKRH